MELRRVMSRNGSVGALARSARLMSNKLASSRRPEGLDRGGFEAGVEVADLLD